MTAGRAEVWSRSRGCRRTVRVGCGPLVVWGRSGWRGLWRPGECGGCGGGSARPVPGLTTLDRDLRGTYGRQNATLAVRSCQMSSSCSRVGPMMGAVGNRQNPQGNSFVRELLFESRRRSFRLRIRVPRVHLQGRGAICMRREGMRCRAVPGVRCRSAGDRCFGSPRGGAHVLIAWRRPACRS